MIVGIGVDVVDLARFDRAMNRTPALRARLFAPAERPLPLHSLAGRFAAKEALIKALGGSAGVSWQDIEVVSDDDRNPSFLLHNTLAGVAEKKGISALHLSMSHDGGVAIAYVIAESADENRLARQRERADG